MTILFFDTETTGKAAFSLPYFSSQQPDVVQLGAILTDDDLNEKARIDLIVLPDGHIPSGASDIHGITDEIAAEFGVSRTAACLAFDDLLACADRIVAHNAQFDLLVMQHAFHKAGRSVEVFDEVDVACTKLASTPICRILHKRPRHPADFKWPSLDEAHRYFYNTGVEGAHSAIPDVEACIRVYRGLRDMNALHVGLTPAKTPRKVKFQNLD